MKKIANAARNLRDALYTKQAALGTAIALSPAFAFAQETSVGAAVNTEIQGGKTQVTTILLTLAGVLGVFILWSMIKRAKP